MALTKAERLALELQAQTQAREAEQVATYPSRLMKMMERATQQNFELKVREGKFVLTDRDYPRDLPLTFTLKRSTSNEDALYQLKWRVEEKEATAREVERKLALKQVANATRAQKAG